MNIHRSREEIDGVPVCAHLPCKCRHHRQQATEGKNDAQIQPLEHVQDEASSPLDTVYDKSGGDEDDGADV